MTRLALAVRRGHGDQDVLTDPGRPVRLRIQGSLHIAGMTDLIGGQVDLMCEQATNAVPQIEGKKVKVYGVTSLQKLPLAALKDTPTLSESGLKDFNVQVWHGLYAPRGTPPEVITRLNTALRAALKEPRTDQARGGARSHRGK